MALAQYQWGLLDLLSTSRIRALFLVPPPFFPAQSHTQEVGLIVLGKEQRKLPLCAQEMRKFGGTWMVGGIEIPVGDKREIVRVLAYVSRVTKCIQKTRDQGGNTRECV